MKLLNIGCGSRYHESWTNIDFLSSNDNIIAHNILQGIPFPDESVNVVYHSHVLEHFSKADGIKFIEECFRVLKPNGIVRIAVPDLERIAREYLRNLELAVSGHEKATYDYEWIKLEMYDQTVRNESGGDMANYIFQKVIPNEEYIYERIGEEARNLRKTYLQDVNRSSPEEMKASIGSKKNNTNTILSKIKYRLKKKLFYHEMKEFENFQKEIQIGKFRLGGEVHQWMYDRYSLSKLLIEAGFLGIEIKDAFTSNIDYWNSYELESKNGIIYKPDSLFMEASK